jgi:hypothetical protein
MAKIDLEVACHYITNACVCKTKYEPDALGSPVLLCPRYLFLLFHEWVPELDSWVRFVEVALFNNSEGITNTQSLPAVTCLSFYEYLCWYEYLRISTSYLQVRVPTTIFNLLKPTGYGMHQQVECFNNCTLYPHCIDVFCICLRTNSDWCRLHKKLIGFITEMKSVYSAVRTGPLTEAVWASSFKG